MGPKPTMPSSGDLYRSRLDQIFDQRHELFRLAALIDWEHFDQAFGRFYRPLRRPAKPTRLLPWQEHVRRQMTASPLTDAEYDRVSDVLNRFCDEHAMNLEELDGFFAALICGPAHVHPSEYLPEIWGGEMADEEAFSSQQQLNDFLDLIMRHWNVVADTLQFGDVFLPLLLEDDHGIAHANDWAQGFMRGMELRREDWAELLDDEDHGGWLVPILALAHEHDPDPTMRPYQEPMDADRRKQLIAGAAAGVTAIYRYFEPLRRMFPDLRGGQSTYRRTVPKIGRNDPCSCGSGKKYKRCCGKPTLH